MKMSAKGLKLLMEWEGVRLRPYKDAAGLLTVGCGHLIQKTDKLSYPLTTTQALDLLAADVTRFENAVSSSAHPPPPITLNQDQFDALVIFAFNVGVMAFKKSSALKAVNKGDLAAVPDKLMLWTKAGGEFCQGLSNRRKKEIRLWNGEIQ